MPDRNQKSESLKEPGLSSDAINPEYKPKKQFAGTREDYVEGIKNGDRALLSRAITLIESSRADYLSLGQEIVESLLPISGNSVRIGITGVPGVGKSTFIDAMGKMLVNRGLSVAVLTVDPSSSRSGGSILGDKTRMEFLSSHPDAYIRPSPTSGTLGGVARKTREAMLLCEAAGFDIVFIETVGVGQSETVVKSMVDFFLLLMLAGAGDELQGIKRGIMEMADLIAINKADGENKQAAKRAVLEYKNALSLFPPHETGWKTPVLTCSAEYSLGLEELWDKVEEFISHSRKTGWFDDNRKSQTRYWLHESIAHQLKKQFYSNPSIKKELAGIEKKVTSEQLSPFKAALDLVNMLGKKK
jgi:LAO/AO transport system kinase